MSKLELGKMISVSLTASHLEIYAKLIDVVATGYFVEVSHPATTFLPLLFMSVNLSERHTAITYWKKTLRCVKAAWSSGEGGVLGSGPSSTINPSNDWHQIRESQKG